MGSKELWSKIGRLTGKRNFRKENNILLDSQDEAEQFLDAHFGRNEYQQLERGTAQYDLLNEETWVSILNRKKKKSAPGEDRITYEMLRQLSPGVRKNLIADLNRMWWDGCPDESLKTIKVVAIPKPGKDQSTAAGKRPISLVPTPTKVVNTAVLDRLQEFIETQQILPQTSFGFRKNISTNTCLTYVVNCIKQNKRDGFISAMICVDLSNAFNAVQTNTLEQILVSLSIPDEITTWITGFLRNRRIIMHLNNGTAIKTISNGLPQGDVLSPTLFNLYTAKLHEISDGDVVLVQYADDFGIIVRARKLEALAEKVQEKIDEFCGWAESLNFKINAEKTKALLFTNNNKSLAVSIDGTPLETVRSHRYLGVTIDRYLCFGQHARETRSKVVDRLNMLKVISGIKTGSHPQTLNNIYTALVRSVMEYGCSVTNNARKTNRQLLTVVNNQCLRKITGCTRSTPLNALTALARQEPIDRRFDYITGKNIARCFELNNIVADQLRNITEIKDEEEGKYSYVERIYHQNIGLFNKIMAVVPMLDSREVKICSSLEGVQGPKKNLSSIQLRQIAISVMNEKYCGRGRIFTDASKAGRVCAVGVFVEGLEIKRSIRLEGDISITSAELHALSVALQTVEEEKLYCYVIYTDSMSACRMLEDAVDTKRAETLIRNILDTARKWRIAFQWVPSHVGIIGNENADELAKAGLGQAEILEHQLFSKDVMWQLRRQKTEAAQTWYEDYSKEKGKQFFDVYRVLKEDTWYNGVELRGQDIRLLNRLMTGHNYAKNWLARMKIVDTGFCDLCDEEETAEHSILICPQYGHIRADFSFECKFANLAELFKTRDVELYKEVVEFVKRCKLNL